MGLGVRLVGRASKRGMIPRLPGAEQTVDEVEAWLSSEYAESIEHSARSEAADGTSWLRLVLHPAAPDVVVSAGTDGQLVLEAVTSAVGPGYHTFVCRLADRLGADLGVTWAGPDSADPSWDDTGYLQSRDRQDVERAHLAWLATILAGARDARRAGRTDLQFATPAGARYTFGGAIATPLGPLDDAWLEAAAGDPTVAARVWPWWADATGARYLFDRAMCLLWTEVRWRPPVIDEERRVLDEACTLLGRAFPLDGSLPYPWREWRELLKLRGVDDPVTRRVDERASAVPAGLPRVGYRRAPVTVVHEGWALAVPGTFAERRTDDEWWGGEAGRGISLAATETGIDGRPMPAETFLAQVAGHLGDQALEHHDGPVIGRARITTDSSTGVAVGIVEGYAAVVGRGAAIRVEFDEPGDWDWALDQWRSLRPLGLARERPAAAPAPGATIARSPLDRLAVAPGG